MRKAAMIGLLVIFVALSGVMMLSGGEHPGLVILVLGGMALFVARGNAIIDRSRLRRGKVLDFTSSFADLAALTRRDWKDLGFTAFASAALIVTGIAAFGRGPN